MTTTSQIIFDAFRQSNLISINGSITSAQQIEALRYLNRLVKSVYGNEAGEQLQPLALGRENISQPQGFPWYDNTPSNAWFVPKNADLMLNITEPVTVYLHPQPDDGTRFGINDLSDNLSINNLTVYGNGRRIENTLSLTIDTSGSDIEWFYRQDLGNWMKVSPLVAGDTFPFPEEFDDLFITMLALRLNPSYGATMDQQTSLVLQRSRSQFSARYRQHIQVGSELGIVRMPNVTADRYYWAQSGSGYGYGFGGLYGSPTSLFNAGLPY